MSPLYPFRFALLLLLLPAIVSATPGDTTWVRTFDHDFYNWATPHYDTFALPDDPANWSKILCYYTIGCPGAPNDCDPWDRIGHVRVVRDTTETEIVRLVTPYDITGSGRPDSCTFKINVTDYKSILRGEVELRSYIESWIGGSNGWLVTVDFAFVEGTLSQEPFDVVDLFQNDHVDYGDPAQPVSSQVPAATVDIPPNAVRGKVRLYTTGHGQGNTDNCAEFCPKTHTVLVDGNPFDELLWRSNCFSNLCSPQGGTWSSPRAGWCPGDAVKVRKFEVGALLTPGFPMTFEYQIEGYENVCRPSNPSCVDGVTCADCNYNSTGHTPPHYTLQGQLILFADATAVSADLFDEGESGIVLEQNAPNPVRRTTTIGYSIDRAGHVALRIYDTRGRLVREVRRDHGDAGSHSYRWGGRDSHGNRVPAGAYFYTIEAGGETRSKKLIIVQ